MLKNLLNELKTGQFEYEHVNNISTAVDRLQLGGIDVLMLELTLLYYEDLDTLFTLNPQLLDVATIILSDPGEESTAVKATQLGFQDYFIKGNMDSQQLKRTVKCAIEQHRIQTELRKLKMINELTGLYTLQAFLVLSQHFLKLSNRTNRGLLFFIIGLSNPKIHGDKLSSTEFANYLIDVANILKSTFRRSDIIAQIDTTEFFVLALESSKEGATIISDRLRKNSDEYFVKKGSPSMLSLDIASAYYNPESPCSIVELLLRARKSIGGNNVVKGQ